MNFLESLKKLGQVYPECLTISDLSQPDEPLIYANSAFLHLTQYSAEEILGRNCRFLQGEETKDKSRIHLRKAIKNRTAVHQDIINYRKDGTLFLNRLVLLPLQKNDMDLFLGFQNDVSHLLSIPEAERRQFVSATEICHEIRNPLTVAIVNMQTEGIDSQKVIRSFQRVTAYVASLDPEDLIESGAS